MTVVKGAGHAPPLEGIFLPVSTPFNHYGDLYRAKLRYNVEKWNRTALAGYVVCGSTGESVSLSSNEKATLFEWMAECAGPGKTLVAAGGPDGVRETLRLMDKAAELGYGAALIEAPPAPWSEAERELYCRAVADRSKLPVIVRGLVPESAARLSAHPNVVADALAATELDLWAGLSAGASGGILALANAAPYAAITIWEAHRRRDQEAGLEWQQRIARAAEFVTSIYGVPGLKYAMDLNGYYGGPCRLPLAPLAPHAKREIEAAFASLRS
ncbi:MAG: dihydrodipicolinate synthase family protein [Bryobacteraceae bacterium]